ncbi:heme exporter protein CcmD [Aestuariibius sp. HNIBRBA575]|uniref:heme exporter protein CcmD n=1 Tax=Aestuariibius sp. HNIBRBA575 TaxID=3233343 RepID=UPI0034A3B931
MPDLGKYAAEVLSAYGLSAALLVGLVVMSVRASRKARAALRAIEGDRADG